MARRAGERSDDEVYKRVDFNKNYLKGRIKRVVHCLYYPTSATVCGLGFFSLKQAE